MKHMHDIKPYYLLLLKGTEESISMGDGERERQPWAGVGLWHRDQVIAGLPL